jgi:hypothetical protein
MLFSKPPLKRRPGTANRRNAASRRTQLSQSSTGIMSIPLTPGKLPMDLEVSKFRPKIVN